MKAAIVTCGGLCPGLNVVIREVVMSLFYNYKVKEIYGIQFGYRGFYSYDWLELTPEKVKSIHHLGGTILGSSRGGFDADKILEALEARHINQVNNEKIAIFAIFSFFRKNSFFCEVVCDRGRRNALRHAEDTGRSCETRDKACGVWLAEDY